MNVQIARAQVRLIHVPPSDGLSFHADGQDHAENTARASNQLQILQSVEMVSIRLLQQYNSDGQLNSGLACVSGAYRWL